MRETISVRIFARRKDHSFSDMRPGGISTCPTIAILRQMAKSIRLRKRVSLIKVFSPFKDTDRDSPREPGSTSRLRRGNQSFEDARHIVYRVSSPT
jgi:hypothetical protein